MTATRQSLLLSMSFEKVASSVIAQLLQQAQDDALGDGLFVGKPPLAQARDDVGECGLSDISI